MNQAPCDQLTPDATVDETLLKKKLVRAVSRGVRLLDSLDAGWDKKINVRTLQLSSVTSCICGQLYEHYNTGVSKLTDALTESRRRFVGFQGAGWYGKRLDPEYYGFFFPTQSGTRWASSGMTGMAYSILTELWTAVVEKRRSPEVDKERSRRASEVVSIIERG